MKRSYSRKVQAALGFLAICLLLFTATPAPAVEIPGQISYQGRLIDIDGDPIETPVDIIAAIYDSDEGGLLLWSESFTQVPVTDGLFSLTLGETTSIPGDIFSSGTRYLSISVGGEEITPRTRLIAVPYSFVASVSDSSDIAADVPDDAITESKIADGAVNRDKLGLDAVSSEHIADGSVDTDDLADDAVTGDNIEDGTVTETNIADLAVSNAKLADGAVNSDKLADNSVDSDKLADNSVDSTKISDGSILFIDLNQNGAQNGQVIKWDGSAWAASHDDVGIVSGWADYGRYISLQTLTDSVGIGTSTPQAKLDIEGGLRVADDIAVGGTVGIADAATESISLRITKAEDGAAIAVDSSSESKQEHTFVVYRDGRVGIGTEPEEALEVAGTIHSTEGGYKFPDGSVQTSAAMDDVAWQVEDTRVVLNEIDDSVGIGTTEPTEKLTVTGGISASENLSAGGKMNVGSGNTNTGTLAMSLGNDNDATGNYSTIAGGSDNQALNQYTVISGGQTNIATGSHSVVAGGLENNAGDQWTFVGGGTYNYADRLAAVVAGGYADTATGLYSAVLGGQANLADGSRAAVVGGWNNKAYGGSSTIGGGTDNDASGKYSVIPGGRSCAARNDYALAAGFSAKANHPGAFVLSANFSLDVNDSIASGIGEQMVLRADAGLYITNQSGTAPNEPTKLINTSTGAYLSSAGEWTNAGSKDLKENFETIDGGEILEKLLELDIMAWNYKSDPERRHIGPNAQELSALFGIGDDNSISTVDPAGIALVAIQELYKKTKEIDDLKAQIADLRKAVEELARDR